MPETTITLLKGDKVDSNLDYRDALPVNVSAVDRPVLGAEGYMLQEPGLTQYAVGVGKDRGGVWNERLNKHIRVSGNKLIEVAQDGTVTQVGTIAGSNRVVLPYSFTTQAIIAYPKMYLYTGDVLSTITDPDLGTIIDGVWVDSYYFLTDGENLLVTDLDSESSIDPLKFSTSEFSPDPTLGVLLTTDNKVAVFNRYTTEFFVNDASTNFPFSRLPSRSQKIGIVGTHAKDRDWETP